MRWRFATCLLLLFAVGSTGLQEVVNSHILLSGVRAYVSTIESLMNVWTLAHPGVSGEYHAVAGAAVRQRLYDNTVDAAVSDTVGTPVEAVRTPDAVQIPLFAQPVVPCYNIPELPGIHLTFTGAIIARIYKGNMTHWNDPELQALNPDISLPAKAISVIPVSASPFVANTDAVTLYLSKIDEEWRETVGNRHQLNWDAVSPAPFAYFSSPVTLRDAIIARPYSFALHYMESVRLGANYGYMVNKAGKVVAPTVDATTFALMELGSRGVDFSGKALDCMDSHALDAWPVILWTYAVLRKETFRDTCAVKGATVGFLKWALESQVARNVAAEDSIVMLPADLNARLGISRMLETEIMCDGRTALAAQSRADVIHAISSAIAVKPLKAMLAAFNDVTPGTSEYQVVTSPGAVSVKRVHLGEVDVGVVVPAAMPGTSEQIKQHQLTALPLWAFSVTPVHSLALPVGADLKLELSTLAKIWSGRIKRWDHPEIAASNPDLEEAGALDGKNISYVVMASGHRDTERFFLQTLWQAERSFEVTPELISTSPTFKDLPFFASRLQPSIEAEVEDRVPDVMSFNPGSVGVMMSSETRRSLEGVNTRAITLLRNGRAVEPSVAGRDACHTGYTQTADGFIGLATSTHPDCYPLSTYSYVVERKVHTGDCENVRKSLAFVRELLSQDAVTFDRFDVSSPPPAVRRGNIAFLESVTCDGETILVLLPEHRKIPDSVTDVAIGLAVTLAIAAFFSILFTWVYRRRHAIKAFSPLFMILTLIGVAMLCITTALLPTNDLSDIKCSASFWFAALGIYFATAPVFAKVARIYKIFFRAEMQVVRLSDQRLLAYMSLPLALLLICLAVVQGIDPPRVLHFSEFDGQRDRFFYYCGTGTAGFALLGCVGGCMALAMLVGVVMAFSTRNVAHTYNESKRQAYAMYNVLFTIAVVVTVGALVGSSNGPGITMLAAFACLWLGLVTWGTVFLPRLQELYSTALGFAPDLDSASKSGTSRSASSQEGKPKSLKDFVHIGYRYMEKAMLRIYVGLLEKELAVSRVQLAQLTVQDGGRVDEQAIIQTLTHNAHKDVTAGREGKTTAASARGTGGGTTAAKGRYYVGTATPTPQASTLGTAGTGTWAMASRAATASPASLVLEVGSLAHHRPGSVPPGAAASSVRPQRLSAGSVAPLPPGPPCADIPATASSQQQQQGRRESAESLRNRAGSTPQPVFHLEDAAAAAAANNNNNNNNNSANANGSETGGAAAPATAETVLLPGAIPSEAATAALAGAEEAAGKEGAAPSPAAAEPPAAAAAP